MRSTGVQLFLQFERNPRSFHATYQLLYRKKLINSQLNYIWVYIVVKIKIVLLC
jgi:hypothetical protein